MTQDSTKPRARRHGQRQNKHVAQRERPSAPTPKSGKSKANPNNTLKSRFERYLELARSAAMSGDEIAAEGHYQHAEHWFRLMTAAKA